VADFLNLTGVPRQELLAQKSSISDPDRTFIAFRAKVGNAEIVLKNSKISKP
jgi:hypothetical protein